MALILASGSPRRRELLNQIGITDFVIQPAKGEEVRRPGLSPAELVEDLSLQKAREISAQRGDTDIILAADTLVARDGIVLGKPHDEADAFRMLSALSGREHQVYTGVTLIHGTTVITFHEETNVCFRTMTDAEIRGYIASGEPMDKAGAYGIQGLGGRFIRRIEGDYTNVVGLPVCRTAEELEKLM